MLMNQYRIQEYRSGFPKLLTLVKVDVIDTYKHKLLDGYAEVH